MGFLCLPRFEIEAVFFLVANSSTSLTSCPTVGPGMLLRVAPGTKKGKRAITMEMRTLAVVIITSREIVVLVWR